MTEATTEAPAAPETAARHPADGPARRGQHAARSRTGGAGPEAAAKPEEKPAEQPEGAPEAYEFTPPEGHVLDEGVIGKFSEVAKELNLSEQRTEGAGRDGSGHCRASAGRASGHDCGMGGQRPRRQGSSAATS